MFLNRLGDSHLSSIFPLIGLIPRQPQTLSEKTQLYLGSG